MNYPVLVILDFTGFFVSFGITAYARAIGWNVPRVSFFVWPLLIVVFPFLLLLWLHKTLENYFAGSLVEERKLTKKVDILKILKEERGRPD